MVGPVLPPHHNKKFRHGPQNDRHAQQRRRRTRAPAPTRSVLLPWPTVAAHPRSGLSQTVPEQSIPTATRHDEHNGQLTMPDAVLEGGMTAVGYCTEMSNASPPDTRSPVPPARRRRAEHRATATTARLSPRQLQQLDTTHQEPVTARTLPHARGPGQSVGKAAGRPPPDTVLISDRRGPL